MRYWLCVGVGVAAVAFAFVAQASGIAADPSCSRESASAAATAAGFDVDPGQKRTPINSVICGSFFGVGSAGMAATVAVPTGCGFSIGWGVFRLTGGIWQLVMHQDNGVLKLESVPLADGAADIRTTKGYARSGDAPCSPSRMQTQVWHWNGTSFLAGALNVTLLQTEFDSPRALFTRCFMGDQSALGGRHAEVLCQSGNLRPVLYQKVTLSGGGIVTICRTHGRQHCNLFCSCEETKPRLLNYGEHVDIGRFRCETLRVGVRCTIISTGKGFLITKTRVRRLG